MYALDRTRDLENFELETEEPPITRVQHKDRDMSLITTITVG